MVLQVNDIVLVDRETSGRTTDGMAAVVRPGVPYRVTRMGTRRILVRTPQGVSVWIPRVLARNEDGSEITAANVRALGVTPEGDHIAVDDPRIAWIWEDAAKIASQAGHCSEYDNLAEKLGAPGRPREFSITATVSGLTATFTVTAISKKTAAAQIVEKFAEAKVTRNVDTGRRVRF